MKISFNNLDAAVTYAAGINGATVSPVFQDEQGFDYWLVEQPFQTVEDESVFDFIENPLRADTHLGRSYNGIWIVNSPNREEGQRFKYQSCVPATPEEARLYRELVLQSVAPTHQEGDWNYGEYRDGEWIAY